jgi:bisphosphoglycerate-independent phosphoglycerate mutase (AlkP superfamily)
LSVAFLVLGVTRAHVGALEVVNEDLSKILPANDDISWQMIQLDHGGVSHVDRKELDDEEVIIRSTHSAHEVVVLQLDTRVSFAVVLNDVAWCSKMLWETSIAHDTSERLWAKPFRTEAASFMIVVGSMVWAPHA